jgi:hypothetical protein
MADTNPASDRSNAREPSGNCSRRRFLKKAGTTAALSGVGLSALTGAEARDAKGAPGAPAYVPPQNSFTVERVDLAIEREPLSEPYGFKGGYVTEGWQSIALLESPSGHRTIGLGKQSPPWADMSVAERRTPTGGNALMLAVTERALQLVQGETFRDPIEMTDWLYPQVREYARSISQQEVSANFALNALMPVDNAAWLLYARENDISDFEEMIPERYRHTIDNPSDRVVSVPSLSYNTSPEDVEALINEGYFIMKMKLGQPGPPEEMLQKDKEHIELLHNTLSNYSTEHTPDGRIPYYFDANMRYDQKEYLEEFFDHMKQIGAFDQILVVEDPFPEELDIPVGDFDVMVASDEPASTPERAQRQIDLGYTAFGLKPIAKTLSMTLKVIDLAYDQDIHCYCADLTVNPTLREWNKMVTARLDPLPMIGMNMFETNGHQYYANWDEMLTYHPYPEARWVEARNGVFELDDDYYAKSGGLFKLPQHYLDVVEYDAE